jgi:hypothetical protein
LLAVELTEDLGGGCLETGQGNDVFGDLERLHGISVKRFRVESGSEYSPVIATRSTSSRVFAETDQDPEAGETPALPARAALT